MENFLLILKRSKLFSNMEENDIQSMLECLGSRKVKYDKNQFIYNYGDIADYVGIVLTGSVLIIKEDFWGNRSIVSQALPGDMFAETYACLNNKSMEVSVIASQESQILMLNCAKILQVCSNSCSFHNKLIENLLSDVAEKNIILTQKMDYMSQKTTRSKLLSYLSAQSLAAGKETFTIPYNRQELADYLSIDRSAMSSQLSKLQKEGILKYNKNTFTLMDI